MPKKKTLLVGWDGAGWDYLEPLLEAGQLPTLSSLIQAGSRGVLQSTLPAWTPTAWASIVTGKNPGKHGVFDMLWRRPKSYDFSPTNSRIRRGTPFWKRLNDAGLAVGLVNVPFTHPTHHLKGFVVHGFGAPASVEDWAWPREVRNSISERFGDPERIKEGAKPRSLEQIFEDDRNEQQRQVEIATEMARLYQTDVLVLNMMHLDHANHNMPDRQAVDEAICACDRDLRQLLEGFQPDNILLISDHGSRRLRGGFRLDVWLRDQGYCHPLKRNRRERRDAINWALVLRSRSKGRRDDNFVEKIQRRGIAELASCLPAFLSAPLWQALAGVIPDLQDFVLLSEKTDFSRSKVFSGSGHSGLLYLNLEGREPQGIVTPGNRKGLLVELARRLRRVVDPVTDQAVFSRVLLAEDIYEGPAVEEGPDLILDASDSEFGSPEVSHIFFPGAQVRDRYFVENYRWFGDHSPEGVFVFSGTDFKAGFRSPKFHVMDVPATLLHLYGIAIPEDYDGRVMKDVLSDGIETNVNYQPGDGVDDGSGRDSYGSTESKEVLDRLRALGYL